MASTEVVITLLKAVNEVTLNRLDDLLDAVNATTLGKMELEIQETAALLKAVNEVTLKRLEDLMNRGKIAA
jgi:hypothetical protein